jgi:hypothetical protein
MTRFPAQGRTGAGGAVVVTLFACRNLRDILVIWWLHHRVKPGVRERTRGFLGVRLYIDWRRRTVRSVSLWADPAYLYDMGEVREHVAAVGVPGQLGVATACGIYMYEGEWTELMFGAPPNGKPVPLANPDPGSVEATR